MNKPFWLILTRLGGIIPFVFKCIKSRSFVMWTSPGKVITVDDDSCVLHATLKLCILWGTPWPGLHFLRTRSCSITTLTFKKGPRSCGCLTRLIPASMRSWSKADQNITANYLRRYSPTALFTAMPNSGSFLHHHHLYSSPSLTQHDEQ